MSWLEQAPAWPVLAWEVKRATRHKLGRALQIGYWVWLLIQALALFGALRHPSAQNPGAFRAANSNWALLRDREEQQQEFFGNYLNTLLRYQLVLVVALTPVLTASSLGQEKERGTLFVLFCTRITSRQILLGMLFGRLAPLMQLVLTTLPILVFLATLIDRGPTLLLLALAQQATVVIALGAAGLLFGIWVRRATDAVVASYFALILAYVISRGITDTTPGFSWIYPVESLDELLSGGPRVVFLAHLAIWALLGAVCLWWGCRRLRLACVEQHDRKPSRRLWAFRPAVGNDPIGWRECHVIGLAPLPILRAVPRWLALVGVFLFAFVLNGMVAEVFTPEFASALAKLNLVQAYAWLESKGRHIQQTLPLMGLVFILLANVVVGIRCGTSVPEEKRQNTWDDLLLTAQSFREITTGKMWGILQATLPYVVAYALPVFFLAWLSGPSALLGAGLWILLPCTIVFLAAWMGIDMVNVPPEMDETRETGAFWYEKRPNATSRRREDQRA